MAGGSRVSGSWRVSPRPEVIRSGRASFGERSRTIESVLRSEAGSAIARRARRGSPQPARRLWTTRFYVDGRFRLTRRSSSRFLSLTRPHPPPITPHPASCLGGGGGVGDLRLPGSGVRVETQCRCGVLSGGQPVV